MAKSFSITTDPEEILLTRLNYPEVGEGSLGFFRDPSSGEVFATACELGTLPETRATCSVGVVTEPKRSSRFIVSITGKGSSPVRFSIPGHYSHWVIMASKKFLIFGEDERAMLVSTGTAWEHAARQFVYVVSAEEANESDG